MKYEFHPEAFAELEDAADFYAERQQGLEVRFLDAIHSAIRCILEDPLRWRTFDGDVHRYLVHVFPYAMLYSVEKERIDIIAVMHCSREPGYWKSRKSKARPGN